MPHPKYLTDRFGDEAVAFAEHPTREPWVPDLALNAPFNGQPRIKEPKNRKAKSAPAEAS